MLQNASYMFFFFFKKINKTKQNDYKKKKKKVSVGRSGTRDIRRQESRRV